MTGPGGSIARGREMYADEQAARVERAGRTPDGRTDPGLVLLPPPRWSRRAVKRQREPGYRAAPMTVEEV